MATCSVPSAEVPTWRSYSREWGWGNQMSTWGEEKMFGEKRSFSKHWNCQQLFYPIKFLVWCDFCNEVMLSVTFVEWPQNKLHFEGCVLNRIVCTSTCRLNAWSMKKRMKDRRWLGWLLNLYKVKVGITGPLQNSSNNSRPSVKR